MFFPRLLGYLENEDCVCFVIRGMSLNDCDTGPPHFGSYDTTGSYIGFSLFGSRKLGKLP